MEKSSNFCRYCLGWRTTNWIERQQPKSICWYSQSFLIRKCLFPLRVRQEIQSESESQLISCKLSLFNTHFAEASLGQSNSNSGLILHISHPVAFKLQRGILTHVQYFLSFKCKFSLYITLLASVRNVDKHHCVHSVYNCSNNFLKSFPQELGLTLRFTCKIHCRHS